MKNICYLIAAAVLVVSPAMAGKSKTCTTTRVCSTSKSNNCSPCNSRTTQWYKAKDGTYCEMLPYWDALSRAEDADDMEIELKATQEELAQVRE